MLSANAKSSHEMRPQQTVGSDRENIPAPCYEEIFRSQHKNKSRHPGNTGQGAQPKFSENEQKPWFGHKSSDGDELVKHMSNLPGFLQHMEKGKTIQEKALNFGVLDWKRLEKWKYTERMPGRSPKKTSPSASGPPKMGVSLNKQPYPGKQSLPHCSQLNPTQRQPPAPQPYSTNLKDTRYMGSHKEEKYIRPIKYKGDETCSQKLQAAQVSVACRQKDTRYMGSHEEETYIGPIKYKGDETCSQKLQAAQVSVACRQQDLFRQRVQLCQRSCSKANMDNSKRKDPRKEVPPPEQSNYKFPVLPTTCTLAERSDRRYDEMKFTTKRLPKNGCSESSQFRESRASLEGQPSEVVVNTLLDFFSTDAPHLRPLPSAATFHTEHAMKMPNTQIPCAIDLDTRTSVNFATSRASEETSKPSAGVDASNKTQTGIAEQPMIKGRAPSPTRRFSFSLGKLSRSSSIKESTPVPKSSSTHANVKSGQVRPEVSSIVDNSEEDRESANTKRQSSPLRRLLNPLLKYKGFQSAETPRPSNAGLHPVRTTITLGPSQDRKPEAPFVQALLQLTFKNELPFFKLVVDNSENMLAAGVTRLPTPGKTDPCLIYTFYSVHEIRKKGMNWMGQGSKSKTCTLGYKIVGQMKISNPYNPKVRTGDFSTCDTRECVLYGADPGQVDKHTLEFVANKEIAAIIVKKAMKSCNAAELSIPQPVSVLNGMVVILPGGVHSIPIKGAPSSLISRWKSGGLCDCGGWDVGCKLRILSDHKKSRSILQASVSSRINLFLQGDELKTKPTFTLEPLKNGLYNVELDASISLLEAFAMCVAHVTCSKFPEIIDMKCPLETIHFQEAIQQSDASIMFQDQLPAKYVTCPPLSPAGRI